MRRFFETLSGAFGVRSPARGTINAVVNAQQTATRTRNTALQQTFLPQRSGQTNRSSSNDSYLFSNDMFQDTVADSAATLFKEEYGQDLLSPGAAGYGAQQNLRYQFLNDKRKELSAAKQKAGNLINQKREARLGNQTGGVRNGVARNPFNMNMMKGPQANAPKKPTAQAPMNVPQQYLSGRVGGGASGRMGGGGGGMSHGNYMLM